MKRTRVFLWHAWLLVSVACISQPSEAAWPLIVWETVKTVAAEVATGVVVDYFSEDSSPDTTQELKRQIDQLEQKIKQLTADLEAQKQNNDPKLQEELRELTRLIVQLRSLNEVDKNKIPVEERFTAQEKIIAEIWQRTNALTSKDPKAPTFDDFKITYVYRTQGKGEFKPLTDGAVLKSGDHYKIIFRPRKDGYVYLFLLDSANQFYQLFPLSPEQLKKMFPNQKLKGIDHRNPVTAGTSYYLPAENQSFVLDDTIGTEKLYFTVSHKPDTILDLLYKIAPNISPSKTDSSSKPKLAQMLEIKGIAGIQTDLPDPPLVWEEGENESKEIVQASQQQLTEFCNSCLNILTFEHR